MYDNPRRRGVPIFCLMVVVTTSVYVLTHNRVCLAPPFPACAVSCLFSVLLWLVFPTEIQTAF